MCIMILMYIEQKYLLLASSRLQQFKRKGDYLWNFRCPYCGDSQTNLTKARGYVFRKDSNLIYKCHNCGTGANLNNFLKLGFIFVDSSNEKIIWLHKTCLNKNLYSLGFALLCPTMRRNILNWCDLVSISKKLMFYVI